ncbi:TPR repeat-containing protein [Bernardetia litoralis DSM 6794]|uniref:TPR repeat-containing protein n=1 Tax=Bernardetia litoralis (strain ATCC 23117 / DSM 6794 / NBRC 15988 / NCIMB 1366 / Fx l1 / Sio-4) TaxID=880071 RepID=I4AI45_BERLS|nr:SEL1-like repeat protein [Bernardetia litoralis]AFM03630.1 TPR repeat-containing protein [Bernardetia litoralis DSM 6794]
MNYKISKSERKQVYKNNIAFITIMIITLLTTILITFSSFAQNLQENDATVAYKQGKEQEKNASTAAHYEKVFQLYQKSAVLGYDSAQVALAQFYELGIGTNVDFLKAADLYQEALKKGNAQAAFRLGNLYEKGSGVEQNMEKAARCYLQAWGGKYPRAGEALERIDVKRWLPSDLPTYRFYLAMNNDAKAQYELGEMYLGIGKNTKPNWIKAKYWLEKAVTNNFVEAQLLLAKTHEEGQIVEKNISLATSYYNQAARQNNPTALAWLENQQNQENSENMRLTASKNTSTTSTKNEVIVLNHFEEGVKQWNIKNNQTAYTHFQKVSSKKEPQVLKYLAIMHKENLIPTANLGEAILYLNEYIVIYPEDAEGYKILGEIYLIKKQKSEAKYYFEKAEQKGIKITKEIWASVE